MSKNETMRWPDYVDEINEHTAEILNVYRTERRSGSVNPWLDVAMMEGARLTADAARAFVALVDANSPTRSAEYHERRLVEVRNAMRKIRRMVDDMFGPQNETP